VGHSLYKNLKKIDEFCFVEEDNSNPCEPKICHDGEWQIMIYDCMEFLVPWACKSGIYIPAKEGECCSVDFLKKDLWNMVLF